MIAYSTRLALCAALLIGLALAGEVAAQTVTAEAEVSPSVVMVGETAQYKIRFLNTTNLPNMVTPRVDGLEFSESMGTSSFQQFINGRVTVQTEASWAFRPTRNGTFTIPARTVRIGSQDVQIPAASLQAVPMDEETRSRAILQLELPDPPFFAGQALPARLSLLIRRDLTPLNIAFPERIGDAFQNTEFSNNPARGSTRVNGRAYDVFVWDILITPIKAGAAELAFRQSLAIQISTPDSRFPSIFSMSRTRSDTLSLSTEPLALEILPLPAHNRPEAFIDAIGAFTVTAGISARELTVGEPVSLTLTVEGKGNFDRISAPKLPEWDGWRLYPPRVTFTPADALGFEGSKSFEYILIPQSTDTTEVPGFSYATFDPAKRVYLTTILEPEPITVRPSSAPTDTPTFLPHLGSTHGEPVSRVPPAILPLQPSPGRLDPLQPVLWRRPVFWIGNGVAGLALLTAGAALARNKRLRSDARIARRHVGNRRIRHALQHARSAARAADAGAFLAAARMAVQESIAQLSKTHAEAKTLVTSDCLSILAASNASDSCQRQVKDLLDAADAHQFAGFAPGTQDLSTLAGQLDSMIAELERLRK